MVLLERIELSTSPLPRECSTSELQQRRGRLVRRKNRGAQALFSNFFGARQGAAAPRHTPRAGLLQGGCPNGVFEPVRNGKSDPS